ncbi:hypothetical protein Ssi02_72050 [Sinosporangium siamense]|uniref:Uncharacterized protein n=1 Tax=Sinosporangium siamense TaxID=1367973 RepID=A0A919RQR7_9ACTN|nr:hypothetical protein Ssi02_72050 [Sinosporangium siamense]
MAAGACRLSCRVAPRSARSESAAVIHGAPRFGTAPGEVLAALTGKDLTPPAYTGSGLDSVM